MAESSYSRWNWNPPAGVRFSWPDAVVLAVSSVVTWATKPLLGGLEVFFPIVMGHFFLFCNIFRIPRKSELLWAFAFLVNIAVWVGVGRLTWIAVLWTQLPLTCLLILRAMLRSDYHGIGYRLIPWGRRIREPAEQDRKVPS